MANGQKLMAKKTAQLSSNPSRDCGAVKAQNINKQKT